MALEFVSRLDEAQTQQLWRLYQGEWWSAGRCLDDVRRLLEGPNLVSAAVDKDSGQLAGFARAITDGVFKAFVFDVIVAPSCRRRGVGGQLLERLLALPQLDGVRHVELYCRPEMTPFYEEWGFSPCNGIALMRRTQ